MDAEKVFRSSEDEEVGANEGVAGCEWSSLRIETMNASLAVADCKPARTNLAVLVDRQCWGHEVSILIAAVGGLAR